jgi:hypothetical protein
MPGGQRYGAGAAAAAAPGALQTYWTVRVPTRNGAMVEPVEEKLVVQAVESAGS